MAIQRPAQAGSLESCDALVQVEPAATLDIQIKSDAAAQFAKVLRVTVERALADLGVTAGKIVISDRGALDYTLVSRLRVAVARAAEVAR